MIINPNYREVTKKYVEAVAKLDQYINENLSNAKLEEFIALDQTMNAAKTAYDNFDINLRLINE